MPASHRKAPERTRTPEHTLLARNNTPASHLAQTLLLLCMVSVAMGQTLVFAILPSLARDLHLMEIQMGLVITASSVVFAWSSRIWGRLSDRYGRKRILLLGLLGYSVGTLLFTLAFHAGYAGWVQGWSLFAVLMLARMLQSTVMSASGPAATAYIADITMIEQRTAGIARAGAAHSLGTILGPAIGGGLALLSLLTPLVFAAMLTLIAALLVWLWLPESRATQKSAVTSAPLSYFDKRYRRYLLISVSMFIGFSIVQQTLGYYFQDRLQLSPRDAARYTGMAMMASAALALLAQSVLVQRFHVRAQQLISWGLIMLVAGVATLLLVPNVAGMMLGMAFVGLGMGMTSPGCTAAASVCVSAEEQGALAGLVSSCPALGYIAGPLIGTGLYHVGMSWPYVFTVLLLCPLIVLSLRQRA